MMFEGLYLVPLAEHYCVCVCVCMCAHVCVFVCVRVQIFYLFTSAAAADIAEDFAFSVFVGAFFE